MHRLLFDLTPYSLGTFTTGYINRSRNPRLCLEISDETTSWSADMSKFSCTSSFRARYTALTRDISDLRVDLACAMDHALLSPDELHLLYILLDSNLPTGGFVSSSGLEVYVKHGFLGISSSDSLYADDLDTKGKGKGTFTAVKGVKDVIRGVTDFADAEVRHYGSTTGCFVKDAWRAVAAARAPEGRGRESTVPGGVDGDDETSAHRAASESRRGRGRVSLDVVLEDIARLDEYHEASMLSHVARRASRAQGVAMLTLFARGLTRPVGFDRLSLQGGAEEEEEEEEDPGAEVVDAYKKLVRKGSVPGHLAVCWGVITASLGLSLGMSPPFSLEIS